jgi:hypothetical protein
MRGLVAPADGIGEGLVRVGSPFSAFELMGSWCSDPVRFKTGQLILDVSLVAGQWLLRHGHPVVDQLDEVPQFHVSMRPSSMAQG